MKLEMNEILTKPKLRPTIRLFCASFDLEAVLPTPFSQDITLFYTRKLAVYNFTIYETATKDGFCYLWNETEGQRGANEIASFLFKYVSHS
jgi:hypothetical protein